MSSTSFVGRNNGLRCWSCCINGSTKIIMRRVAKEHPGANVQPLALPAAVISPLNWSWRGAEYSLRAPWRRAQGRGRRLQSSGAGRAPLHASAQLQARLPQESSGQAYGTSLVHPFWEEHIEDAKIAICGVSSFMPSIKQLHELSPESSWEVLKVPRRDAVVSGALERTAAAAGLHHAFFTQLPMPASWEQGRTAHSSSKHGRACCLCWPLQQSIASIPWWHRRALSSPAWRVLSTPLSAKCVCRHRVQVLGCQRMQWLAMPTVTSHGLLQ
eukprot:3924374-Amphidinium_carterae.2